MKGTDILDRARRELKDFIVFEGKYYYNLTHKECPNWENGEDWVIDFADVLEGNEGITYKMKVWDDWDTTIDEFFTFKSIHISFDDNLFIWDEENEENDYGVFSIEQLTDIANILEEAVMKIVHKEK